jgi:hypothetical protein
MGKEYWTCPICGKNLDPGEKCDCQGSVSADPVRIVTVKGMIKLGYPPNYVRQIVTDPRQTFAFRMHPGSQKSPYLIDLDKFEEWKERQIKLTR